MDNTAAFKASSAAGILQLRLLHRRFHAAVKLFTISVISLPVMMLLSMSTNSFHISGAVKESEFRFYFLSFSGVSWIKNCQCFQWILHIWNSCEWFFERPYYTSIHWLQDGCFIGWKESKCYRLQVRDIWMRRAIIY